MQMTNEQAAKLAAIVMGMNWPDSYKGYDGFVHEFEDPNNRIGVSDYNLRKIAMHAPLPVGTVLVFGDGSGTMQVEEDGITVWEEDGKQMGVGPFPFKHPVPMTWSNLPEFVKGINEVQLPEEQPHD